jgi:hypothetical protein
MYNNITMSCCNFIRNVTEIYIYNILISCTLRKERPQFHFDLPGIMRTEDFPLRLHTAQGTSLLFELSNPDGLIDPPT